MDKIIPYDSEDAARFVTGLSGWVDRFGRYYGENEDFARYSGCTHRPCPKCGTLTQKEWTICNKCLEKIKVDQYKHSPKKVWDGKTMLYSEFCDTFFADEDEILNFIESDADGCNSIDELRLRICEPVMFPEIDADYFYDYCPDDGGITPKELEEALEELNKVIRNLPPASWRPGKYAAIGVWDSNIEPKKE